MKSISTKNLLVVIMIIFLFIQNYFFTTNDSISLLFVFISTFIMYFAISKYQNNNKKVLKMYFKEGSVLHAFFSKENTLFIKLLSFIMSFILSFLLVIILRGISHNHGNIALFLIIAVISMSIFSFITDNTTKNETIEDNLQEDLGSHASELLHLILVAFILTVILSLILSARDTYIFLQASSNNLDFYNFMDRAESEQIIKNNYNNISRKLMNFYIIMENFKMAFANNFVEVFFTKEQREAYFYIFYLCVFFLNMMKLFGFSLAFVFLQKGLVGFSQKLLPYANKFLVKIDETNWNKLIFWKKEDSENSNKKGKNDEKLD